MISQTPQNEELFANTLKARSLRVFAVCLTFLILVVLAAVIAGPGKAVAATNGTINFQARLENAAGNIAADGSYNVEFKLYNGSTGGTALWTEDYLNQNSQGVTVKNGYLTVNLGSITSLPNSINYDQDLWLTMTVRGTGSCAFASCTPADAEMSPRLKLTASAYAFRAGQIAQFNAATGFTSTLGIASPTGGNQTFVIQDQGAAGTYNLLTSGNGVQLQASTPGSAQTGNFNISGTGIAGILQGSTKILTPTLDTASAVALNIGTTNATQINLNQNTVIAGGKTLTMVGNTTALRPASPSEGTLYYDTTTKQLLTYANGKWQGDRSASTKIVAASNSTQAEKDAADYVATGSGDQATINAAITAATGGKVYLMEGTYTINGPIVMPSNTTLTGAGASTVIKAGDNLPSGIDMVDNSNSGTATGNTNITITNLTMDGNRANNTASISGLNLWADWSGTSALNDMVVRGVTFQNFNSDALYSEAVHSTFSFNWFINSQRGLDVETGGSNTISGNHFLGTMNDYDALLLDSSTHNNIVGNEFSGAWTSGVYLSDGADSNTVVGNIFTGMSYHAVYVGVANTTVSSNTISSVSIQAVDIESSSSQTLITGNRIADSGGSTDNEAIFVNGAVSTTVTSNVISDSSATTNNYAIDIASPAASTYLANNVLGNGSVNDATTGTTYAGQQNANGYFTFQSSATRLGLGTLSPAYMLDVGGDINTTTGYRVNGTAGSTMACSGGQVLSNQVVRGGIVTGGTCATVSGGSGSYVTLQSSTPGTPDTGNINVSGTVIAGYFSGDGSALTNLNASNLASGTVASARISGAYGNITGVGTLTSLTASGVITSTVATGTAPFTVASTTAVTNLNADKLDGYDATGFIQNQSGSAQLTSAFWIDGVGKAATFNATSGYQINGTAGSTVTCSGGQVLSNQVVQGGLVTGGTCATVSGGGGGSYVTLQASTPGTPDTGSFNISGTGIAAILQAATFDTASAVALNIGTTNATQINLNQSVVVASGKNLTVTNGTVYSNAFDRATSGTMTIGATNATAITIGNSTTATTVNNTLTIKATTDSRPLGSEMMTSSYGFTAAAGWTSISGTGQSATATHNGTISDTTALALSPALNLNSGTDYQISITVTGRTVGYFNVYVAGSNVTQSNPTGSVTTSIYVPTTGAITIVPSSTFDGTITGLSIKPYTSTIPPAFSLQNASGSSAVEIRALSSTTNLTIGLNSGQNITSGTNNIALGNGALRTDSTGSSNTAIGYSALGNNSTGGYNVALGQSGLGNNTSGSQNSAFGFSALSSNTTGARNNAYGYYSLNGNTTGADNNAFGSYSLQNNTTGLYNNAFGQNTLASTTTGSGNSATGYYAMRSNTTGSYNSALGFFAGYQDSFGHFSTLATLQNATAIGANAQVQTNNSIVLGSVDNATKVGIGTTVPSNTFSVSPLDYQTGTATRTNGSATLTGTSTTWTSAMVGDLIVFADGTTNTVAGFTDATHITMGTTFTGTTDASPAYYRFHKVGLQVKSTGNVGVGNVSPAYALDITGDINSTTLYRINGTAGASISCTGGNLLQNATVSGGIVTGGSCVAAGGGSGVSIVGTIDGGTYSDNGASISGSTIYLQAAGSNHTGLVTYGNQTFGGIKTFAAGMTVGGAFVLQEATAPAGATGYGKLYVSSSDHNLHFVNASGTDIALGSGGGGYSGTHTIKISPEFPNSVFTTGGQSATTGYMQTDFDTGLTAAQGYKHTYYSWTTDQATAQTYDITMLYQIPSDFTSFATGSFKLWAYGTDSTKNSATVIVKDVDGTQCMSQAVTLTNTTWTQTVLPDLTSGGCSFAANDLITITIRPSSSTATTNETRIGEIQFSYN